MSLRRADHSSRGVLPTVLHRCVWSRNIKNGCSIYIYEISSLKSNNLTLILLTWRKWRAPNNASKLQTGFNSGFKVLMLSAGYCYQKRESQSDHNKRLPLLRKEVRNKRRKQGRKNRKEMRKVFFFPFDIGILFIFPVCVTWMRRCRRRIMSVLH